MAEARGDAGALAGDVVELQGAVTADVGSIHDDAGKLAIAANVEKKVTASSNVVHLDTPDAQPGEDQEYDSGEDVYKGNDASFTTKDVEKIKAKGVASFYNRKIKKWHCPYYPTKPKPKDGRFDHLVSHAEDVVIRREDYMIRGQHAALTKALTPV
ncbi:hypothetical protein VPH35_117892 [Triticum aestivum]